METKNAIDITGLYVKYGNNAVLEGIELTVRTREIVSIIGPNGSGKTTLLKAIMGLIPVSKGHIEVFGMEPQRAKNRSLISYLSQAKEQDSAFPVTVYDVVSMILVHNHKWWERISKRDHDIIMNALDFMGIAGMKDRHFGSLSGGQKQKVLIARALAFQPKILFLDEPSTGLDIVSRDEFYRQIRRLRDEMNLTVVMVTHDISMTAAIVDKVAYLNRTIHFFDSPEAKVPANVIQNVFGKDMQILIHSDHCLTCSDKEKGLV